MRTEKNFLSCLSALIFIIFSQSASAHMLFNYKTAEMQFQTEEAYQTENGNPAHINLMTNQTFQFDVSFVTPDLDLDLEEMEVVTFGFENAVTSVTASGLFENSKIEGSHLWLEVWKVDGELHTDWNLTLSIMSDNLPEGAVAYAYLTSENHWDYLHILLGNYLYMHQVRLDVQAQFSGEYQGEYPNDTPGLGRFSMNHVSAPEPLTPALFLFGMAGIFAARKVKNKGIW